MEEMRENINPATLKGVIGRKWYLIISTILGTINAILMFTLSRSILMGITDAVKNNVTTNIFSVFNSGLIPENEVFAFLFCLLASCFFGFINNTKRLKDITGNSKTSIMLSVGFIILTISLYFLNFNSFGYALVNGIIMMLSFVLLFKEGKYVKPKTATISGIERSEMVDTQKSVSFWRRWLAHLIDNFIILNSLLSIVLLCSADLLYKLGIYAILIAQITYILYYGIMNSRASNGQTLGKMALGIKVIDKEGDFLPVGKSLLRAIIYTFCVTTGVYISIGGTLILPDYITLRPDFVYTVATLVTLMSALYLTFLFNTKTRQTFHDFAAGSFVVLKTNYSKLYNPEIKKAPIIVASVISLVTCFTIASTFIKMKNYLPMQPNFTQQIHKSLKADAISTIVSPNKQTKKPMLTVTVRTNNIKDKMLAQKVYSYLTQNYPDIDGIDNIKIVLQKSYTIGPQHEVKRQQYTVK